MKSGNQKERLEKELLEVVDFYRGFVLDTVEQELGTNTNWQYVRGRLLKALGDRGIAGRIREVLNTEFGTEGDSNER